MRIFFYPIALVCCTLLYTITNAQQPLNQINIITFVVKNKLPANIDAWGTVPGSVVLVAQKLPQVRIKGAMLAIQIKQNGAKICGSNPQSVPLVDSFTVRNFTTSEIIGYLSQCPILKAGNYQLCAQFLNIDRYPISKEVCKEFVVEDAVQVQQSYSPPQNISPANDKKFTEAETKLPITFRWTPIVPKPKEAVTYRLKVWQLMQGQSSTQAMRSNQPIIEKEVNNINQAAIPNMYTGPCKPPYLCDFVWSVQGIGKENAVGENKNYGTSEATSFSIKQNNNNNNNNPTPTVAAMASGANAEFKIDSVTCLQKENGLFKYHIWAHYKNQNSSSNNILLNDALNFPGYITNPNPGIGTNLRNNIRIKTGSYNGALTMNDIVESNTGTISNITPLPATILTPAFLAPNSTHNFQFDFSIATNSPVQFTYYGLVDDPLKFLANRNTRNEIDSLQYPKCPCSACDEVIINTTQQGSITNNGNGSISIATNVSSTPKKVKRISAELVYFDMKPDDENCLICNKNSNYFGNFITATTTNTNFTNSLPYPHTAQFVAASNIDISGGVMFNFNISNPPMVSCCNANVNFCIRYVITYEDCTVCNKLACYNYKITGCQKQ